MENNSLLETQIFNILLKKAPCKVFVIDRSYKLLFYNEKFNKDRILFTSKTLKKGLSILPDNETKKEWQNCFDLVMNGNEISLEKNYFVGEEEIYDFIRLIPFVNANDVVEGCIFFAENILPLKRGGKILLDIEMRNTNLLQDTLASIVITDKDLNFIKCNQAMLDLAKIKKEDLLNMNGLDFSIIKESSVICLKLNEIRKGEITQFSAIEKYKDNLGKEILLRIAFTGIYKNDIFNGFIITMLGVFSKQETEKIYKKVEELKIKEELSDQRQAKLTDELAYKNRELYANLMLVSKQNDFLIQLEKDLQRISKKANTEVKLEINRLKSLVRSQKAFDENWKKNKVYFEKVHPNFFEKLRKICPSFTEKELKHGAFIKIGLSNKETSQLLNVRPKTVEMARYRIKKKLKLSSSESLSNFFSGL